MSAVERMNLLGGENQAKSVPMKRPKLEFDSLMGSLKESSSRYVLIVTLDDVLPDGEAAVRTYTAFTLSCDSAAYEVFNVQFTPVEFDKLMGTGRAAVLSISTRAYTVEYDDGNPFTDVSQWAAGCMKDITQFCYGVALCLAGREIGYLPGADLRPDVFDAMSGIMDDILEMVFERESDSPQRFYHLPVSDGYVRVYPVLSESAAMVQYMHRQHRRSLFDSMLYGSKWAGPAYIWEWNPDGDKQGSSEGGYTIQELNSFSWSMLQGARVYRN